MLVYFKVVLAGPDDDRLQDFEGDGGGLAFNFRHFSLPDGVVASGVEEFMSGPSK